MEGRRGKQRLPIELILMPKRSLTSYFDVEYFDTRPWNPPGTIATLGGGEVTNRKLNNIRVSHLLKNVLTSEFVCLWD